ncbi:MAG: 50S ribosomal protein L18 [Alphaproteobacteria bacterium]|jgi:large subunit ribosomal protein L18
MLNSKKLFERRKRRTRYQLRRRANGRPRLSVFRSSKHIYAQLIDDLQGLTLASAGSNDKDVAGADASGSGKDVAVAVGKLIAARAKDAGVSNVIFDRGGYRFHGRVKALADAAREGGLNF